MTVALTSVEVTGMIRDIVLITFFVIGVLAMLVGLALGLTFYRKAKHLMDRVDAGVERVEAMVESVDSTASTVRRTATSVNRGMRAGDFARSAFSSVFPRRGGDENGDSEESNGRSESK